MSVSYGALSLSQTPPLWVPLRFFLTAPLFLLAAGLALVIAPHDLFVTRWRPEMLALTHLLTLGFLGTCMLGAVQQLVPVLAGAALPWPEQFSRALYGLWTPGVVLLVSGMAWGWPAAMQGGAALLGLAVLLFVIVCGHALWRSTSRHDTRPAIGLALLALLGSVVLAIWLLWQHRWQVPLAHPLTRLHIGWASLVWVAALIMGVAYQVVPMFQLTSPYPRRLRRLLVPLLAGVLLAWTFWPAAWLSGLAAGLLAAFALTTLWLQQHRRRRVSDPTLDFWRVAMVSLLLAGSAWLVWLVRPEGRLEVLIGVLFLAGFAGAAVNGMLYKIVPFLIWLHLSNRSQQAGRGPAAVPNMKQIIPEGDARRQWWLQLLALLLLLVVVAFDLPPWPAGLAWTANGLYLFRNLLGGVRRYRTHLARVEAG
jgi:hypothetical protein